MIATKMSHRFERGMTLMEILVVVLIVACIIGISIAAFSKYLQQSRLSSSTRQIASAISLTRLKAVSTNMTYTFTLRTDISPNSYTASGTNDIDASGTLQPWEDVTGSGTVVVDKLWETSQSITRSAPPAVDHQGISNLPTGNAMSESVNNGDTLSIVFDGRGMRLSMVSGGNNRQDIVLQNAGFTQAIHVTDTGYVSMYRYTDPGWIEMH